MIQEADCSYEVSTLLKEKGFDEKCHSSYWGSDIVDYTDLPLNYNDNNSSCSRPTHQMACAWLREKHEIFIQINRYNQYYEGYGVIPMTEHDKERGHNPEYSARILNALSVSRITERFESYEEAVEAGLKYCLENLI